MKTQILSLGLAALVCGCGPSANEKKKLAERFVADTVNENQPARNRRSAELTDSELKTNTIPLPKNFISSMQIKGLTADAANATMQIEHFTNKLGAYVQDSKLTSELKNKEVTRLSKDSVLEQETYQIQAHLILRVPNSKLDTVLAVLTPFFLVMDERILRKSNSDIDLLENKMTALRTRQFSKDVTPLLAKKSMQIEGVLAAQNQLYEKVKETDLAMLENEKLRDKINFSGINIELYQRDKTVKTTSLYLTAPQGYHPGFLSEVYTAIVNGANLLKWIVLAIINLWSSLLIAFATWFIYKLIRKKIAL